jgi:hypothetical protein
MNARALFRVGVFAFGALTCSASQPEAEVAHCLLATPDFEEVASWLAGGDWRNEFDLDRMNYGKRMFADIVRWIRSRADSGDAKAQWVVAEEIIFRRGVNSCELSPEERLEATALLLSSAKQGYAPAKLQLGMKY